MVGFSEVIKVEPYNGTGAPEEEAEKPELSLSLLTQEEVTLTHGKMVAVSEPGSEPSPGSILPAP